MSENKMTDPRLINNFIYAGKSIFTIRSAKTGNHFTFRVDKKKDADVYFVKLAVGYQEFEYLGYVDSRRQFRTTAKSCRPFNAIESKAIHFLLANLNTGNLHKGIDFFNEGICGRCGRPLTDPESIERGLGPTCTQKGA